MGNVIPFKKAEAKEKLPPLPPPAESKDALIENTFNSIVLNQLQGTFEDNLFESGFSTEEVDRTLRGLISMKFEDAARAMAIPAELAKRNLASLHSKIEHGQLTFETAASYLLTEAVKHGFGVGYHNSPTEIRPDAKGSWFIKPTEQDHRDNDLGMAYYSTSYKTLYRKKAPKYLYIVRTLADTSRTDGNWSRGPGLSIVAMMPIEYVDETVSTKVKEKLESAENTEQKKQAAG